MTWVKGQSGNPAGGPKGVKMVKPAIIRALKRMYDGDEFLALEKISERLVQEALHGEYSLEAIKIIYDRLEGKAMQQVSAELDVTVSIGSLIKQAVELAAPTLDHKPVKRLDDK